jgi:hypothetical protein
MIPKSGCRFAEQIMLKIEDSEDAHEKENEGERPGRCERPQKGCGGAQGCAAARQTGESGCISASAGGPAQ